MKRWSLIGILMLLCLPAKAADGDSLRHWGVSASLNPSAVVGLDRYVRKWLRHRRSLSIDIKLAKTALPEDSDAFAADYNYPLVGLGVRYGMNDVTMHRDQDPDWGLLQPVDYHSRLGNIVSFYGSFQRPLLRSRRWEAGYGLGFGTAWAHRKYSRGDNIDNEFIGSRWLIYFSAAVYAKYHFAREWGLKAGVEFSHHSNGALNRPNKGANYLGPELGIVYEPYYNKVVGRPVASPFAPYWYLQVTAGIGAKTLNEDWQLTQFATQPGNPDYRRSRFHVYPAYSVRLDVLCRYARRWASGVGMDVFYGPYANHIARLDAGKGLKHSPWSVGLSAKHKAYYHQLSLDMSLGYYLLRRMGDNARQVEKPYYEHIGVHYTFRRMKDISIGINIKAHLTKADFTEIVVGWPFRLSSNTK